MRVKGGAASIAVERGAITDWDVDAIVNAANSTLAMGAGVAAAIKRKGGVLIEEEAMRQGPIDVGEAVLTPGGNLAATHVIHAVAMGPDLKTNPETIARTTRAVLALADKHRLTSIALPALGTGVGHVAPGAAAEAMLTAVVTHLKSAKTSVNRSVFVLYQDEALRAVLARRIAVYSFALLLGSMLIGGFVLRVFDLSLPIVQLAGGIVVCGLGWQMLADAPKPVAVTVDPAQLQRVALGRAFYPLTMPLSVDAGGISVAITVGTHHASGVQNAVVRLVGSVIGAALVGASIFVTYRYAHRIGKRIGPTGMTVLLQLSAFITLCIGVAISWTGLHALLGEIHLAR